MYELAMRWRVEPDETRNWSTLSEVAGRARHGSYWWVYKEIPA